MKVSELIEELSKEDGNKEVMLEPDDYVFTYVCGVSNRKIRTSGDVIVIF
jgi:hypothetical protein